MLPPYEAWCSAREGSLSCRAGPIAAIQGYIDLKQSPYLFYNKNVKNRLIKKSLKEIKFAIRFDSFFLIRKKIVRLCKCTSEWSKFRIINVIWIVNKLQSKVFCCFWFCFRFHFLNLYSSYCSTNPRCLGHKSWPKPWLVNRIKKYIHSKSEYY